MSDDLSPLFSDECLQEAKASKLMNSKRKKHCFFILCRLNDIMYLNLSDQFKNAFKKRTPKLTELILSGVFLKAPEINYLHDLKICCFPFAGLTGI
jgi:hypothetical protein